MTPRASKRDPERSYLELRRLAGRAHRNPDALAVLQDAVQETLPTELANAIEEAERQAVGSPWPWVVWFFPARLNRQTRRHSTTRHAFEAHRSDINKNWLRSSQCFTTKEGRDDLARAIVIYRTGRPRYFYQDPDRNGRGYVYNREYEVIAQRASPGEWRNLGGVATEGLDDEHDAAFYRWTRQQVRRWSRGRLIQWLQWNDPNGSYDDPDDPLTHEDLVDLLMDQVEETKATPEEVFHRSRRRW